MVLGVGAALYLGLPGTASVLAVVRVAVVFPHANRRAGVERVAWELSDFLGARHETTFVGLAMEESDVSAARCLTIRQQNFVPAPVAFRRAAQQALKSLQPDVTVTLGAECPPGDVYWVQSVHRAYLDGSPGLTVAGWQAPAWIRLLLPRHRLILAMERQYFQSGRPQAIMCTSAQEISDLGNHYGVLAERCSVMPNGFDPTTFNPARRKANRNAARARLGIGDQEMSLLFVANELHRKGFGTLIEALARANLPGTRIDVVGRVSQGDYERKIAALGLAGRVFWHESTSDVFPHYAAADLLVLPTQYEPFGIVIVEALASGLPVITSRLAGAAAAVETCMSGRLLNDPTDASELASYLTEGSDPTVLKNWSALAAAAAQPYAWPTIFAELENVLLQALTQRSAEGQS